MPLLRSDVLIVGTGFGGTIAAMALTRMGLDVVLIDRARHPRFAIGESSTPIANMVLRALASRYDLPMLRTLSLYGLWKETHADLRVGKKRGFSYFHHAPGRTFVAEPDHAGELLVAASASDLHSDTHWLRSDVDAFLAQQAQRLGATLFEDTQVLSVDPGPPWRLHIETRGDRSEIRAPFLLDASGAGGFLAGHLDLPPAAEPLLTRSRAVFGHFTGVRRWQPMLEDVEVRTVDYPFTADDAALHHVLDGAWMWVLRFGGDLVSAGFALDVDQHPLDPAIDAETEWTTLLQRYPAVAKQFEEARPVNPPGAIVRSGLLQRRCGLLAGEHWALLPYTAGFVDPLHSTGIAHTLCGLERLVPLLTDHLGSRDLGARLAAYARTTAEELRFVDGLVSLCYRSLPDFRLFVASCMLYFAASIAYERDRLEARSRPFSRAFLCAEEPGLQAAVQQAHRALRLARERNTLCEPATIAAYEALVQELVEPYNHAGLFRPPVPRMYAHTAAPVGA